MLSINHSLFIKSVQIIDPSSPFHREKKNIFIEKGQIKAIDDNFYKAEKEVDASGAMVSPGWFDMWALFGDPGHEFKEDLESGCNVAMAGGFTEVALLPNTHPVIQTKNDIQYLKSGNHNRLIKIYPIGAVTIDTKGENFTEMIDLHSAGAIAFSDGDQPIWHTDIMLKTLQYLQKFNGLLINRPEDKWLDAFGTMHEGVNSTMLGLKGMPRIAEEVMVMRDLQLLEYSGGRLHFANVSSRGTVDLIREAKRKGLAVSCHIAAHQIALDDSYLTNFDTNYKVNPPLREKDDIAALIEGVKDGTIDVIASAHNPQDEENKNLEFDLAAFGAIGLQTVFPVLNSLAKDLTLETIVQKVVVNPRQLLNIPVPTIKENEFANLTFFNPEMEWTLNDSTNFSKSKNSPFYNAKLKGKAIGVVNREFNFWNF